MSTYKELKGLRVKYVPTDTTSPSTAAAGDVWYNTASGQLKGYVGRAAWHSSSPMTEGRTVQNGGTGPVSAALFSGGNPGAGAGVNKTEEYNGSGWSNGGNLNTARVGSAACGTTTAAIHATGEDPSGPSVTVNAVSPTYEPVVHSIDAQPSAKQNSTVVAAPPS